MRRTPLALASTLLVLIASTADSGQVRVNVSGTAFTPSAISLNQGDQVVWVWTSGSHTVTQGSVAGGCPGSTPVGSIFSTGDLALNGARFAWKSDRTGSIPYFCIPHCDLGMVGSLNVAASGVSVSDFRITEVRHTTAHEADYVEIANLGTGGGNLGQYRLSVQSGVAVTLPLVDIVVPVGGRVVVHFGVSGTNTQTDLFFAGTTLGSNGSAALYVPNTVNASLAATSMLVDFVQWGAAAQPNEATAVAAGYWASGAFAPSVADDHAIEFCGTAADRGVGFWQGITNPNPGTNGGCSTPATRSTWGRVKAIYR